MARPRIELDKKDFESLLAIQCTLEEIAAFFDTKLDGCSEATGERWCKRTYGESFAKVSSKRKALGKISVRRAGFRLMEKNASVWIFMAKNYLGMSDTPAPAIPEQENEDALSASLRELAEKGLVSDE